jgi:hypothetical protein
VDKKRDGGLHIHHITPRSEFESVEASNSLSNLITLCPSCHRRWEELELRMNSPPSNSVEYQLDEKTSKVLDVFKNESRVNPIRIREQTGLSKQEVNTSLNHLMSMDLVEKPTRGLYDYTGNSPSESDE